MPEHNVGARDSAPETLGTFGNFENTPVQFLILVALLYMHGWGYLRGYYGAFGISLSVLDLMIEDRIGYAVRSLYGLYFPTATLVACVTFGLAFVGWRYFQTLIVGKVIFTRLVSASRW